MIETVIHWISHQFQTNVVFSGLTGASLIASATYLLRSVPKKLYEIVHTQCVSYMYVTNDDYAFSCINHWLAQLNFTKRSRRLNLNSYGYGEDQQWVLTPGAGRHFFFYKRRLFWVDRNVNDQVSTRTLKRQETIVISTFGRSQSPFRVIINSADLANRSTDGVMIYGWRNGWWTRFARREKRSLSTVVLPERQKSRIIKDLFWFANAQQWYVERGIPYHRGYLLSGPPGTGKTSFIFALASHFGRPIYLLNLSLVESDGQLQEAFSTVPAEGFLLIEDVDACQSAHSRVLRKGSIDDDGKSESVNLVTLSGLLNVIDGVATAEGRVYFMTSNYPDKLDNALLRPGRVDVHETLEEATHEEAKQLFKRFYPRHEHLAGEFASSLPGRISPAELQNLFMRHPVNPDALLGEKVKLAS